ncbi:MAG: MBL fold metallo-hydrolase, partial [Pseudomonadota bacterium]
DMEDYLASLKAVRARKFDALWPTHGPPVLEDVTGFIDAYIAHRHEREAAILARLEQGDETIPKMVDTIYAAVDPSLHPAACHSVLGHIIKLVKERRVTASDDPPSVSSVYRLAD